jgi:hypothetical protein
MDTVPPSNVRLLPAILYWCPAAEKAVGGIESGRPLDLAMGVRE